MDAGFSELFNKIILPSLGETLYMILFSAILSSVLGFFMAIILIITDEDGLRPNKIVYGTLGTIINVLRSFPFIILIVAIIPLTKAIVGTSIGENAAIVSLTVAGAPFIARLIEGSLREVNPSLIEAAKSFGASDVQIVFKVMVTEAIPSMISNITLSTVTILGCTAMAGAVGAGGLGAIALTYGYQNFNDTIMYSTVFVLVIFVQLIQVVGNLLYRKLK